MRRVLHSDLFAIAGTLYHLLIGTPPPDALERAAAHIAGQPDPLGSLVALHVRCPGLPVSAAKPILCCLSLDPTKRIASAKELRRQFSLAGPERAPLRRILGPERIWARRAIALVVMLIGALLLALVVLLNQIVQGSPTSVTFDPTATQTMVPLAPGYAAYGGYTVPTVPIPTFTPTPNIWGLNGGMSDPYPPPLVPITAVQTATAAGMRLNIQCVQGSIANSAPISPDGLLLAMYCDSNLYMFRVSNGKAIEHLPVGESFIGFTPDSTQFVTWSSSSADEYKLSFWGLNDTLPKQMLRLPAVGVNPFFTLSPDGKTLVAANSVGEAIFIDIASLKVIACLHTDNGSVGAFSFSPSGRYVALGSIIGNIRIWERTGDQFRQISTYNAIYPVRNMAFSADEQALLVGLPEGHVHRYGLAGTDLEIPLESGWQWVQVAPSPINPSAVLWDNGGKAALYHEGDPLRALPQIRPSTNMGVNLAFTPDGHALVVNTDQGVQIWSLADQPSR